MLRSKDRRDFLIILILFNFGTFLGLTPYKNTTTNLILIYPIMLLIILLMLTIYSVYNRILSDFVNFNTSQIILDFIQAIAEAALLLYVIINGIIKRKNWKNFRKLIINLEKSFKWVLLNGKEKKIKDISLKKILLLLLTNHFFYLMVQIYDNCAYAKNDYLTIFIIFRFESYYIMYATIFINFICLWLKNRYNYLEENLKTINKITNNNNLWQSKEIISMQLNDFYKIYKYLYLIVEEINNLFGTFFFLMTISSVLVILNAVSYAMTTPLRDVDILITGDNMVLVIYYAVYNIQVITACDSVSKSAKKIYRINLMLQGEIKNNRELREELRILSAYIRGLTPEFSASGFWKIDQRILSALFSSIMTYLIVIIQFNMSLQQ